MGEDGLTWLERAPRIKMLPDTRTGTYPLNWEEQQKLQVHIMPEERYFMKPLVQVMSSRFGEKGEESPEQCCRT